MSTGFYISNLQEGFKDYPKPELLFYPINHEKNKYELSTEIL